MSFEAERAALGTVVMVPRAINYLVDEGVGPEHFGDGELAGLYRAMLKAVDHGQYADPVTLAGVGRWTRDSIDALSVYGSPNAIRDYAKAILDGALWRQRLVASQGLVEACHVQDEGRFAAAEHMLSAGLALPDDFVWDQDRLAELLFDYFNDPEDETFKWPFRRLDDLTMGGVRRGQVTLVGGHSSHGKSTILDQALRGFVEQGLTVQLYINEMTVRERILRWVSGAARVPLEKVFRKRLAPNEMQRVASRISHPPYPIVECAGWSAERIVRHWRRSGADVIALDCLHLIAHRDERDLAGISQVINEGAKRANAHVLATVHLNEGRVQSAVRPMPTLGDIRGSGMLKNDADNVLFVWRDQDPEMGKPHPNGAIYFAKVRNGEPGGVKVLLDGPLSTFVEDNDDWRQAA